MLHELGDSLQAPRKRYEGTSHPDRNDQFEDINATAGRFLQRDQPVISVDTKKKELVGNFKNGGREWRPKRAPEGVRVHDFPADSSGKAIPYGVYDMARNEAWVSVGQDHDTPAFAVASIRHWWQRMGRRAYPQATDLFITADAGGSNGYRCRAWKLELQQVADATGLRIHVSHLPPGTSKWNKIEHRLFCHNPQDLGNFFWARDDCLRPLQLPLQPAVLGLELFHPRVDGAWRRAPAAPAHCLQGARLALPPPVRQERRVQPLRDAAGRPPRRAACTRRLP